jgi:hypothetical protein
MEGVQKITYEWEEALSKPTFFLTDDSIGETARKEKSSVIVTVRDIAVRDELTRKVDLPWQKTVTHWFLTVETVTEGLPRRFFSFHHGNLSHQLPTIRKNLNLSRQFYTVRGKLNLSRRLPTFMENLNINKPLFNHSNLWSVAHLHMHTKCHTRIVLVHII